ncbi:hypothetical protein [Paracoccus sp. IB05]|uniref:hypothetical protein n=1 Tax=Paracoccus sp. IB05 TaxID=2779367 RepID=UPI0018E76A75|nr:hypothetical protein [Paracoccus sp. IB05]MBJ2149707.1 hypothetical protein [Paracoccus sp. IB05]
MEASEMVAEELDRGLPHWKDLPDALRPALERHCANLVGLAASLRAAGRESNDIRELVAELLRSYGADLIAALETKNDD